MPEKSKTPKWIPLEQEDKVKWERMLYKSNEEPPPKSLEIISEQVNWVEQGKD